MEQSQIHLNEADPNRLRLLDAAKAMVLRGDKDFSIADLCGAAGLERSVFHDHFAGKTALMAALMRDYAVAGTQAAKPVSKADTTSEPSVSTPDEWFERRLRVFERALTALEAKAEATAREQARVIAELQERLNGARPSEPAAVAQVHSLEPLPEALPQAVPEVVTEAVTQAEMPVLDEVTASPIEESASTAPVQPDLAQPEGAPQTEIKTCEPVARTGPVIGDVLPGTRNVPDLEKPEDPKRPKADPRARLMAIAAALLVSVFVGIGFMLGRNALDTSAQAHTPDAVAHRVVAQTNLHKTMALADAGDARAQARLALAYLRGQGSARDADAALLWCMSAAKAGNPVAQYLLGALYQQGDHVKADPAQAVQWFSRAAEQGNLKAMHNLGIAYAQGQGIEKDPAKAAEWFTRAAERGYIDSAFDLAVLYERGEGVPQDLKQAMKWYGIAALAGDQPAKERTEVLRGQMKVSDIRLANNAAMAFAPLPAPEAANSL